MSRETRPQDRPAIVARAMLQCSIVLAGVAFASTARAECSRATLQHLADTYVQAQTDGKAGLLPLADGASPAPPLDPKRAAIAAALARARARRPG